MWGDDLHLEVQQGLSPTEPHLHACLLHFPLTSHSKLEHQGQAKTSSITDPIQVLFCQPRQVISRKGKKAA